jgi:hypothetical protein
LGYCLAQIDSLPNEQFNKGKAAFYREDWAEFSTKTEALFRESHRNVVYDKEGFLQKTLASFNQLMQVALKVHVAPFTLAALKETIEEEHLDKPTYIPHPGNVKLTDCSSPAVLAYQFHAPNLPPVPVAEIKQAVNRLVDQYLKNSWFIDRRRKEWALGLKNKISQTADIDAVIHCLTQAQVEVVKEDITESKSWFRKTLKPLHFFGHSRYQSTLSQALNLATTLSIKMEVDELISNLTPLVTNKVSLTLDEIKELKRAKKSEDGNTAVIVAALENAITIKSCQEPVGMLGRRNFFNSQQDTRSSRHHSEEHRIDGDLT